VGDVDQVTSDSPHRGAATDDGAGMTSRDAASTLIATVERTGPPWSFVPSTALAGRDLHHGGARSWPVVLADGQLLGVVVRDEVGPAEHDELITLLLRTVSALLAAEQAAAEARLRADAAEQQARVDPLTGLLNRRAWDDAMRAESARMRRNGTSAVIVVVDIDSLKETNDREGHLAGDLLIRRAADALRGAVRDEDVVARLGGDEFAVLAVESATVVPHSLLKRIDEALGQVEVQASVGAASAGPTESLQGAFDRADRDMYARKRRRKAPRRPAEQVV
jgi:diguanylate cyclase (GGDEF)-like protein